MRLLLVTLSSAFAVTFLLLAFELRIRSQIEAWPFEPPLFVPEELTAREATLRWRFSSSAGRNSLGLRNREVEPRKTATKRILLLGDSLVWSGGTSSGELYTAVLERRLNTRSSGAPHAAFEVINAGVPGYTTYQNLEFLRIHGLDMKPDLVILGFVFNDLFHKYLHRPTSRDHLLGLEPDARRYRFDRHGFPGAILGWSYAAHDLAHRSVRLFRKARRRPVFPFEERSDFYLAWKSYGWVQTRKLIGEMKALLAEQGIPLDVLIFPVSDQVNDVYRKLDEPYVLYPQSRILEICDEYGLRALDLTAPLYQGGGVALFQDYLHLNGKGNDVVADELEKHLMSRDF